MKGALARCLERDCKCWNFERQWRTRSGNWSRRLCCFIFIYIEDVMWWANKATFNNGDIKLFFLWSFGNCFSFRHEFTDVARIRNRFGTHFPINMRTSFLNVFFLELSRFTLKDARNKKWRSTARHYITRAFKSVEALQGLARDCRMRNNEEIQEIHNVCFVAWHLVFIRNAYM